MDKAHGRTTPDWASDVPKGQPQNLRSGPTPRALPGAPVPNIKEPSEKTDWAPVPKVAAAAVTVPLSGLVTWVAEQYGFIMPPHVAGEVAVLIALLAAYLVPDR